VKTEVLIIGCGPAGSAAACTLAERGRDVLVVDRRTFAREKTCGDGLIPDALRALERLGLKERVLADATRLDGVRVYAPGGGTVLLRGEVACLPRKRLDELMRVAALERGARFMAPLRLARAIERDGQIAGAAFDGPDGAMRIDASFTILATGAATDPLEAFGVCERRVPSAVAARFYLQVPDAIAREHRALVVSYDRAICPGYGWIFPGPDGVFNVGVGYFGDAPSALPTRNPRKLLARFVETFALARELVARSRQLTDVRGAPLRTAMTGATLARPGLFVIGEAAGLTYSLTGEGIGKAIESGIIAGAAAADALRDGCDDKRAIADAYAAALRAQFADRFYAYVLAQRWLAHPTVADFVAWRANCGERVRRHLESLLAETEDPRVLFSATGLLKSLLA
jgi:geranylgeranyl reductase family protein